MLHKRNMGHLKRIADREYSGLETGSPSPLYWERIRFSGATAPSRLRPLPALPIIVLILEKELCFFTISQDLREKLPRPWPQPVTSSVRCGPGFIQETTYLFHTSEPQEKSVINMFYSGNHKSKPPESWKTTVCKILKLLCQC